MNKWIPEGYHTLTPHLMVDGAARAMALYERAFGARVLESTKLPNSEQIMHARLAFGDSRLFLSDPAHWDRRRPPASGVRSPVALYIYVPDCDATYQQALAAGLTSITAPEDMFYGDRLARVGDPFGYDWTIATHLRDVSAAELNQILANPPS